MTQNALIRSSVHGVHPVKRPHQPAKGMASPVIRNSHCRAGCIERCSPSSTEARRSNRSAFVSQTSNPDVLSDGCQCPEWGRCGQAVSGDFSERSSCTKWVSSALRCKSSHGVRSLRDRSTCADVGSRRTGDSLPPDATHPGTAGKSRGREELNHERLARACR